MRYILAISVLLLAPLGAYSVQLDCAKKFNDPTNLLARSYMKNNGLIHEGDEQSYPELGVDIRWSLLKLTQTPEGCFLIMAVCTVVGENKECPPNMYEVMGLVSDRNGADRIVPFEQLYPVPRLLIAKIGFNSSIHTESPEPSFYYALLSGNDAVDASKSLVTGTPYAGFSGVAVRGSKAAFDPSLNRDWQITQAHYSLRRGPTAEVLDVQAFQLDGLVDSSGAEGYWKGCEQPGQTYGSCEVAPWNQAFIRDLIISSR